MDLARHVLMRNLAHQAEPARRRMALTLDAVSYLTGVPLPTLIAVEQGDDAGLSLDELTNLAIFFGLTAIGNPRPKHPGAN
jgi:hypothetical protein